MGSILLTTLFLTTSQQFGLPAGLLESLCYVESKHDINAIHKNDGDGNSVGICEIKLKTAKWLGFKGTEKELMQPKTNIYYAGKYLAKQINRYHNVVKGVIAYNIGHAGCLTYTSYSDNVIALWRKNINVRRTTSSIQE